VHSQDPVGGAVHEATVCRTAREGIAASL